MTQYCRDRIGALRQSNERCIAAVGVGTGGAQPELVLAQKDNEYEDLDGE
jgi:hypothetical protein